MSLLFCIDSDEVLLHRAQNQHTCRTNCSPRNPMTIDVKDKITRMFDYGFQKRKEIEAQLVAERIDVPPNGQLNNLIRILRSTKTRSKHHK